MEGRKRVTLEQLAQSANANPWACPRCGCMEWRTIKTYFAVTDNMRHRRQMCRHCGYKRMTWESAIPPQDIEPQSNNERMATNSQTEEFELSHIVAFAQTTVHEQPDKPRRSRRSRITGT